MGCKGKHWKLSEEQCKKFSLLRKGRIVTEETKKKIGAANKGKRRTQEVKDRLSLLHKSKGTGWWLPRRTGLKWSQEVKDKMRNSQTGSKNHQWKGGITKEYLLIRNSAKYSEWRKAVYARDNYTCVLCGSKGKNNLQADHIKPFAYFPELRFNLSNGRTLCVDCHKRTDTYLWKAKFYGI